MMADSDTLETNKEILSEFLGVDVEEFTQNDLEDFIYYDGDNYLILPESEVRTRQYEKLLEDVGHIKYWIDINYPEFTDCLDTQEMVFSSLEDFDPEDAEFDGLDYVGSTYNKIYIFKED